jgi:hypothetical protein
VNDLELLGDPVDEYKAVLKYLRAVPRKYRMLAMAIEQTVNLWELTIEELTGRFATAEEGYELDDVTDGFGKILLTEEEWAARHYQRGGSSSGTKPVTKPKPQGNQGGGSSSGEKGATSSERKKGNYRYCGKASHWAKECHKAKRDRERGIVANLAEVEGEEESSLLTAVDCVDVHAASGGIVMFSIDGGRHKALTNM